MMRNSNEDMLSLVAEAVHRLRECEARVLNPNAEFELQKKTLAKLNRRYGRGDYRHDDVEASLMAACCNGILELWCHLQGQDFRGVEINPTLLIATKPLQRGAYRHAQRRVRERWTPPQPN